MTTMFSESLNRIQMRQDGRWVTLGGKFDNPTADERIGQYADHYMTAPSGAARSCTREFRVISCDHNGNPI